MVKHRSLPKHHKVFKLRATEATPPIIRGHVWFAAYIIANMSEPKEPEVIDMLDDDDSSSSSEEKDETPTIDTINRDNEESQPQNSNQAVPSSPQEYRYRPGGDTEKPMDLSSVDDDEDGPQQHSNENPPQQQHGHFLNHHPVIERPQPIRSGNSSLASQEIIEIDDSSEDEEEEEEPGNIRQSPIPDDRETSTESQDDNAASVSHKPGQNKPANDILSENIHKHATKISPSELESRRKRRRRLYQLVQHPSTMPSFISVLTQPEEQLERDDASVDEAIEPTEVVINVDAYLGLSAETPIQPDLYGSSAVKLDPMPVVSSSTPSSTTMTSWKPPSSTAKVSPPPQDGWFTGCFSMSQPEDQMYLGEMQVLVRRNLELFTATDLDVRTVKAGRLHPTVKGKVGMRCIHCAKVMLPKLQSSVVNPESNNSNLSWPNGAVSYPVTISGMQSAAAQKPHLHFEHCPNLPIAERAQLAILLQNSTSRSRKKTANMNPMLYYYIWARQIGLEEFEGGMRLMRDPALGPLPFAKCRSLVEQAHLERRQLAKKEDAAVLPYQVPSMTTTPLALPDRVAALASKIPLDAHTNQVLEDVSKTLYDPEQFPGRPDDRGMISDYLFLVISQMAICHATHKDMSSRGPKSKMFKIGFAGYSCRHCTTIGDTASACRSFSSAPDNIASAVSSAFVLHLLKCQHVPLSTKKAINAAKKVHAQQNQALPYGSQRRFFSQLWDRLRATDQCFLASEAVPSTRTNESSSLKPPPVYSTAAIPQAKMEYPRCTDPVTLEVLKKYKEDWNPHENDMLILPEHRHAVTDYLFLCARQLKVAVPSVEDFQGNRRNNLNGNLAGICCMHCDKQGQDKIFSTGRSFPTAPDNCAVSYNFKYEERFTNNYSAYDKSGGIFHSYQSEASHTPCCFSFFDEDFIQVKYVQPHAKLQPHPH